MGKGHGEKLSRKQEQAIGALLQHPTLTAAAEAGGVDARTLRRWLADPLFKQSYRMARRQVVEHAVGRVQEVAGRAVETLQAALSCDHPGTRVRSALGLLELALKGVELSDVLERLDVLERR